MRFGRTEVLVLYAKPIDIIENVKYTCGRVGRLVGTGFQRS